MWLGLQATEVRGLVTKEFYNEDYSGMRDHRVSSSLPTGALLSNTWLPSFPRGSLSRHAQALPERPAACYPELWWAKEKECTCRRRDKETSINRGS